MHGQNREGAFEEVAHEDLAPKQFHSRGTE